MSEFNKTIEVFVENGEIILEQSNITVDAHKGINMIFTQYNLDIDEAEQLIEMLHTAIERIEEISEEDGE